MQLELVITANGRSERRLLPQTSSVSIGRDPNCTVTLDSALVSRRHVTIDVDGNLMRVSDSSRNGTLAGAQFINNSVAQVPRGIRAPKGARWVKRADLPDEALPKVMRKVLSHALD